MRYQSKTIFKNMHKKNKQRGVFFFFNLNVYVNEGLQVYEHTK